MCAKRCRSWTGLRSCLTVKCCSREHPIRCSRTPPCAKGISAKISTERGPRMAMIPRLEMRQGQALVMTPQLQQAIKLLQLSNVELTEFVEGELERNPLLERVENEAGEKEKPESGEAEMSFDAPGAAEASFDADISDVAPDLHGSDLQDAGAAPLT